MIINKLSTYRIVTPVFNKGGSDTKEKDQDKRKFFEILNTNKNKIDIRI